MRITINFEDTYEMFDIAPDFSYMHFNSFYKDGRGIVLLKVICSI
jgi:hypothetical protein